MNTTCNLLLATLLVGITGSPLYSSADVPKRSLCDNALKIPENINALRSFDDYQQVNDRNDVDYLNILGSKFAKALSELDQDSLYVDQGGGTGFAAIQFSLKKGVRTIVINPQDYSKFLELAKVQTLLAAPGARLEIVPYMTSTEFKGLRAADGTFISKYYFLAAYAIASRKLPRYLSPFSKLFVEKWEPSAESIIEEVRQTLDIAVARLPKLRAEFVIGFAENELQNFSQNVTLLSDVFGAFYYSPKRLDVLNADYNALKVGGKGFIHLNGLFGSGAYGGDIVILKDGRRTSLTGYLTKKFPNIFETYTTFSFDQFAIGRTLMITKVDSALNLHDFLEVIEYGWYRKDDSGYAIPKLVIQEK